ncbi:MAG: hypothetical protein NVSMB31_00940 [Vulcanimicrobiaceae bacterium]
MQPLSIPGAYVWSSFLTGHELSSHSYFFVRGEGNVAVDPLPVSDADLEQMRTLGGLKVIVLTTRDHLRDSVRLAQHFGAEIITSEAEAVALGIEASLCGHGEEIFKGAFVIGLDGQKTPGQFALNFPSHRAVLVGDAVLGSPAGALSLLDAQKYDNLERAALGLRRLLVSNPEVLLVSHGSSLYSRAHEALLALLYSHAGIAVHRINLDELDFEFDQGPSVYAAREAEVGFCIGAQGLGYRVVTLSPGARYCPLHAHMLEEELFLILEGTPSIRSLNQTIRCRKGDFIALPTGQSGSHQLCNESEHDVTALLLARVEPAEVCYYPDSDKFGVYPGKDLMQGLARIMVRASPALDYFEGE